MHKCSFCIHQIELVVYSCKNFSYGCCIRNHTGWSHTFSQIPSWYYSCWLIVYTNFKTSWTPIYKFNRFFSFDCLDGFIYITWDNITSIHHSACHVLSMSWITVYHHVLRFEKLRGDISSRKSFMIYFLRASDRSIRSIHKVNSRIWD